MAKKVYLVENLDCANCAAKVEAALGALPEVQEAVLTYATMQLRITAEDPDDDGIRLCRLYRGTGTDIPQTGTRWKC